MRRIGRFLVRAGLLWFAVYVLAQAVVAHNERREPGAATNSAVLDLGPRPAAR